MPKPACVKCQRFYRPAKNGTAWIEGMPIGGRPKSGVEEPASWKPYKLWLGDLWRCDGCGSGEIIVGNAPTPISIQHEHDFLAQIGSWKPTTQINDC